MTEIEIPKDIWKNIFSYFHSSYKCPGHYIAIMENRDFIWLRFSNKNLNKHWPYNYMHNKMAHDRRNNKEPILAPSHLLQYSSSHILDSGWENTYNCSKKTARDIQIYVYGNSKDLVKYTGSYYFKIFMNSQNSTSKNVARFNHYYEKRDNPALCAGKNVLHDFIEIFQTYKLKTISQGQQVYATTSAINYI